jgi:hypothetical protein
MNQPSLIPAPSPHQERAVRIELTPPVLQTGALTNLATRVATLELRAGIEPALSPWQGDVIPLDQRSRLKSAIGNVCGAGGRIRTFTKLGLSQLPLPIGSRQHAITHHVFTHQCLVPAEGVEPSSTGF